MFEYANPSCSVIGARRGAGRHPLLSLALLAAPLAVGCDEGEPPPDETMTVTIATATGAPPALVAFRDEDDTAWQAVTAGSDGTFQVKPAGPYRVVIACEGAGSLGVRVDIKQYARTLEDGLSIEHACAPASYPFHVRGQIAQSGVAYLGEFNRAGFTPPWSFDFPAASGTFDLVMRTGERIALRRDLAVTGDVNLGSIDVSQENPADLVKVTFMVSGQQQGELINASSYLDTGTTNATLQDPMSGSGGWTTALAPESVLRTTDRQTAQFFASRLNVGPKLQNYYRFVERDVRVGGPTAVTLPEPLGPVTFEKVDDRLTATGSTLPEHDEISLGWGSITMSGTKDHAIALSRHFLDATGEASISLELRDIPGFKDEWRHAPGTQQVYELTASRHLSGEILHSQMNEYFRPGFPVR